MRNWTRHIGIICLLGTLAFSGCSEKTVDTNQPVETSSEDTTKESETLENGLISVNETVIVLSDATLRNDANVDGEVVAEVPKGTTLTRIGYGDVWSMVSYNGTNCYVATQYISVEEGSVEDSKAESSKAENSKTESSKAQESESQSVEQTNPQSQEETSKEVASSVAPAVPETNPPLTGDIASLDNTPQGWGYGPSRDEKNRPTTALNYQKQFGAYADFIKEDTNTIYLTMDEGYEYGFTPTILDTLKEKNVKAVFFLTKQFVEGNPDLVKRMVDEGHVIGNHSSKHPANGMPSFTIDQQVEDIMWMHNYIKDNYGYEMKLFRYPAGIFSQQSLALLDSLGYRAVFWSFAHKDWIVDDQPAPSVTLQRCVEALHPGAIYLLHAVSQSNTQALGDFIDQARALGYEFGVYK